MEDPNNEKEVTLVLRGSRIKAQKDMLARNSLYFAALFSANFKDHQQEEFDINYDISLTTLQTFVNWANNEGEHARVVNSTKYHFDVRVALEKFLTGNHSELLELLNYSVVFAAEKLTDNITEMIICMRLHPDVMYEVWLLAEDLQLKILRDVAFASCLDRFDDLSLSCLVKLSKDNFLRLVLNTNVHSSPDHMVVVIEEWKKKNCDPALEPGQQDNIQAGQADRLINATDLTDGYISDQGNTSKDPTDFVKLAHNKILTSDLNSVKRLYTYVRPRYMACIAGRESDNTLFVWGLSELECDIIEIVKMTNSQMHTTLVDNGKEIVGRQVIGRAFSIYLIGGELGLGTGRFNTTLWRYCLISKKWYIETILPQPRRHMAVAFLKNKLYLFGGVGRHRLKLSSVDVYDIYTGTWSQAADIPETFTEVPASCVTNGKFVYNKSFMYVYDPISDEWKKLRYAESSIFPILSILGCGSDFQRNPELLFSETFIDLFKPVQFDQTRRKRLCRLGMISLDDQSELFEHDRSSQNAVSYFRTWPLQDKLMIYQQMWFHPWLITFGSMENEPYVDSSYLYSIHEPGANQVPESTITKVDISGYTFRNKPADCFKSRLGCFKIIEPQALHHTIDEFFLLCLGK